MFGFIVSLLFADTQKKDTKSFDNIVMAKKLEKLGKDFSQKRKNELKKDPEFKRKTFNEQQEILLKETAEYLNQFHPAELNPQSYEGYFGYHRFKRIIHPVARLRGTDAFTYLALRQQLFRMYDRVAISFDIEKRNIKGTPGRTMYYYDLIMGKDHHYISVALLDLSNIIEGYPKNQGYIAVCKRVSKKEYRRGVRRQKVENHSLSLDKSLNTLWNLAKVVTNISGTKAN